MSENSQLCDAILSERSQRALARLQEIFQVSWVPRGLQTFAVSENGINDLYMNLNRHLQEGKVGRKEKLLVALGVAAVSGSPDATKFFQDAAKAAGATDIEAAEAVAAAIACSIYNGYYKFRSLVPEEFAPAFAEFKASFNATMFVKPPFDEKIVEAICVTVSTVNNCKKCVEGHVAKAKSLGLSDEQLDEILKAGTVAFGFALACGACGPVAC
ncbi:MAG: carboxymuconolactone decarboxylase family protein [Candidatus Sumerlaeaceae bacterium]|nr:carboxymuconolactone decarboxylase family protein [Candidatus Sumerlaeaceae bacterium]